MLGNHVRHPSRIPWFARRACMGTLFIRSRKRAASPFSDREQCASQRHHADRLAERVGDVRRGPDRRVLQARGRLDPALVPRKSPERKQEFIGPGEERRHAHVDGAAYRLAQVAEQADRV